MKTYVHLWQYLAEFFLEWETFQMKLVEKITTHVLWPVNFFPTRKSCSLLGNVEKYRRAWRATGDTITGRMRFAYWITKAKDTHWEYVIYLANPRQQWLHERASMLRLYANRSACKTGFLAQFGELSKSHSDPQISCDFQNSFRL